MRYARSRLPKSASGCPPGLTGGVGIGRYPGGGG
jgi:hypothetical protein